MIGMNARACLGLALFNFVTLVWATGEPPAVKPEQDAAERAATVQWLAAHARPLRTAEPTGDHGDLDFLHDWIGRARIVSLGEATHGTREFFQLKHRIFRHLVEKEGFTAFAFEAALPEAMDIDHYVQTGEGDPRGALAGLYFWTWDTEEVLDLIRWMRAYNADPKHARKIHFYGFDIQSMTRPPKVAIAYLEKVDPALAARFRVEVADLLNPFLVLDMSSWSEEHNKGLLRSALAIAQAIRDGKEKYTAISGADAWEMADRHAQVFRQYAGTYLAHDETVTPGGRDGAMAENVDWILAREGKDARIVLWAHNYHIATLCQPARTMGCNLREHHDRNDMFILGFAFNQGGFQSRSGSGPGAGNLSVFDLPPAAPDSFDGTLAQAGPKLFAFNLRELPAAGPVAEWMARAHPMRDIGAVYDTAEPARFLTPVIAPRTYDALLFVDATTAARPTSPTVVPPVVMAAPVNLDFEQGCVAGAVPQGWTVDKKAADFGFSMAVTDHGAAAGRCALAIRRKDGVRYGEVAKGLSQSVEAGAYRDRTLLIKARTLQKLSADGSGYFWVRARTAVDPKSLTASTVTASSVVTLLPTDTGRGQWHEQTLTLKVPKDADNLLFGYSLVGGGEIQLDEVRISAP